MKIEYDTQADAIYVQLREGTVDNTVEVNKYIYADVDAEGNPLGIEILFVKKHMPPEALSTFTVNLTTSNK